MCQQGKTPSAFPQFSTGQTVNSANLFFFPLGNFRNREAVQGWSFMIRDTEHSLSPPQRCLLDLARGQCCVSRHWPCTEHPAPPWHWERLKSQILIHFCPFTQLAFSQRPQEHLISLGLLSPTQDGTNKQVQTAITYKRFFFFFLLWKP